MVSEAPYGVEYNPDWREEAGLGRQRQTGRIAHDDRSDWGYITSISKSPSI